MTEHDEMIKILREVQTKIPKSDTRTRIDEILAVEDGRDRYIEGAEVMRSTILAILRARSCFWCSKEVIQEIRNLECIRFGR